MFLRLCTRAPCTAMVVRAVASDVVCLAAGAIAAPRDLRLTLEAIRAAPDREKTQPRHVDIALLGELTGRGRLADYALVGQVLAGRRDPAEIEMPLEMRLDLGA